MLPPDAAFGIEFLLGIACFGTLATAFAYPSLRRMDFNRALALLLLGSAFRYLGLNFAVEFLSPQLSPTWSSVAACGDLVAGLTALVAAWVSLARPGLARGLGWTSLAVGVADFAVAIPYGIVEQMPSHIGSNWFIVTIGGPFWVVVLFLTGRLLCCRPTAGAPGS